MSATSAAPWAGDYTLLHPLDENEFGTLYAAAAPARLGVDRAAVRVAGASATDAAFEQLVQRLRLVATLAPSGLVELYEAGLGPGERCFYVTALAPFGSLAAPARQLSVADVLRAVAAAAAGTHALHEAGVAHGGIRPAGILLYEGGSRLAEPELSRLLVAGRTFTGRAMHAPDSIHPALIRGAAPSRRTDIWALGATLHLALTGRSIRPNPPPGDLVAQFRQLLDEPPAIDPGIDPDHAQLVRACLGIDETPIATGAELADRLHAAAAQATDAPAPTRTAPIGAAPIEPAPSAPVESPLGSDAANARIVSLRDRVEVPGLPPLPVEEAEVASTEPRPMVEGILCKRQHFNPPIAAYCRICGVSMLQQTHNLVRGPRPPLGILVLDDGSVFALDGDYLIGREPERDAAVAAGRLRPISFGDEERSVSAVHAELRLEGWKVMLCDRGSTNGTHIASPGTSEWTRLEPGQATELRPGTSIALGHRTLVFESQHESA